MTNDFDSQPDVTQSDLIPLAEGESKSPCEEVTADPESPAAITPKGSNPPLKLVTSIAVSEPIHKSTPSTRHYFTAEIRRRSPDDFIMAARDPFHYLYCELPLKFEKNEGVLSLICQFPTICDDALVDFIEEDEDLLGMVLISFHMQILKNLFILCAAHTVQKLTLQVTEDQFEGLGIYEEFIKYVDKIPTKRGMTMELIIPFQSNSLEQCDELINTVTMEFRQTLWHDQSSNPAIRAYLKSNVRLSIVG